MTELQTLINGNLRRVRDCIAGAAERSGRSPDTVKLVAVTKYVGDAEIQALVAAGCCDLGESRPQELCHKAESLNNSTVRWHLIGHLQRNKVRRTIPHVSLLHAGDSERLLEAVNQAGQEQSRRIPVLLEVNISGDSSKTGFRPHELESMIADFMQRDHLEIRGMMAMSGLDSDAAQTRREFSQVRELQQKLKATLPASGAFNELSMGMSGDFEIAIEEGATLVRIGSALFEGLLP